MDLGVAPVRNPRWGGCVQAFRGRRDTEGLQQ